MTLSQILEGVTKLGASGNLDLEVTGMAHDSRKVSGGHAFFALPGSRTDGNRFIKDALGRGAAAVVSELEPPPPPTAIPARWVQVADVREALSKASANFFGHPSRSLKVIGVTGTNGKTTVAYMLESILFKAGARVGVIGTVNYRFQSRVVGKAETTTPLALDLQRLLRDLLNNGASHIVLEASSHALALKRVEDVIFDVAVFTNLHRDHLDFHKDREEYFKAKLRLFEILPQTGAAVLNKDDERFAELKASTSRLRTITYGLAGEADLTAQNIVFSMTGTEFDIVSKRRKKPGHARMNLIGRHNVYNALAAAAAADALEVPFEAAEEGLEALKTVPGRLEPVEAGQRFRVFVDFAHTDGALGAVLENLKRLPHKRLITVFGCGGDRDRTKRGPMGVMACVMSDLAIITSDNPRSEHPEEIISDILRGVQSEGLTNYEIIPDRKQAVERAIRQARPEDVILIAGKGHENYQILKDRTIHFDDREIVLEAIRGAG